jgi:hypothetical protein
VKSKKKTDRNENKRFPSVGPITSREKLVQRNLRSELTLLVKQYENAERKAQMKLRQHRAALKAYIKGE